MCDSIVKCVVDESLILLTSSFFYIPVNIFLSLAGWFRPGGFGGRPAFLVHPVARRRPPGRRHGRHLDARRPAGVPGHVAGERDRCLYRHGRLGSGNVFAVSNPVVKASLGLILVHDLPWPPKNIDKLKYRVPHI